MVLDIVPADKPKRLFRVAMWWLRKEYAKETSKVQIHDDMVNCGNTAVRFLYRELMKMASNIKEKRQAQIIMDFGEFALWVAYRDTAYRAPFFYIIKQVLDMKEELYPEVEKYCKEPKDWYINLWHDSKKITKEQREKGKIGESEISEAEKYFVPNIQQKRMMEAERELNIKRKRLGG